MAVRRVGDNSTTRRVAQDLGRILVTVDDLRALQVLMTDLERAPGYDSPPEMGFKGGEFDSPDELVELSDEELRSIWLRSANIEVELSTITATALGRRDFVEAIYQRWARPRQTNEVPVDFKRGRSIFRGAIASVALICGATILLVLLNDPNPMGLILPVLAILAILGGATILFAKTVDYGPPASYAVVRSVTLNDYRAGRTESQKHWRTIAMSAVAASIALLGLVLGLLFKK